MIKENIVSLVDGFTIELNPKVRHKLKSIPLDKKNNVYITYLPDATENDILETVDFVSKQELTPITHLPARTMKDLDHVSDFLKELRNRTDSKKILVIGGGGNQNGSVSSSLEILECGLLKDNDFEEIGIAGHPEGSPDIDQNTVNEFLNKKYQILVPKSWFRVHKIVFTGGLPPHRPPALPGGLPAPQTLWRGLAAFRAPLHTERLRLSGSP